MLVVEEQQDPTAEYCDEENKLDDFFEHVVVLVIIGNLANIFLSGATTSGGTAATNMKYHLLGKSELKISEITFGCMSLEEDQTLADRLIHQAIDGGINCFDTADLYQQGRNEEMVGRALKGKRKEVVLATKVGNQLRADGSGWDWNPRKEYIIEAVEKSLIRLQTDYIDLYQLHGGTIDDPIDETIEAFELLQDQGKIRYYGTSSIRPNVIREYVQRSHFVSNMMQYSLLDRRPEESALALLGEKQVGVLARGVLAQGILAGKSRDKYLDRSEEELMKAQKAVAELASAKNLTEAQVAVQFALAQPAITSVVAGIRTEKQLIDYLDSENLLSPNEIDGLSQILPANFYQNHR